MPDQTAKEHFNIDFESIAASVPSLTEQASLPLALASNAAESVWNSGTIQWAINLIRVTYLLIRILYTRSSSSVSSVGMSENPFPRRPTVSE